MAMSEGGVGGKKVMCYIGYPKGETRQFLDIVYPGTTQIDDRYDYVPLFELLPRKAPSVWKRLRTALLAARGGV